MRITRLLVATLTVLLLAACASSPSPRYAGGGYSGGYAAHRCGNCGVVEGIERVYGDRSTTGTGAVVGGIVGGVLGNQVGSGSGRRAATAAGAIAGGVAGNAIERDVRSAPRYEIYVRMDDGRRLVVTQPELQGIRNGAYVQIRGNRAYLM
jgi:outer membrane lipoprotein SlyB